MINSIRNKNKNGRICAVELFSSSVCNLNCEYCYIPKNKEMAEYHKIILEKLCDGTFIENLKEIYGTDGLTHLGLWGTEQTLVLDKLIDVLPGYLTEFPNLNCINFSTNLIAFPEKIVELSEILGNSDRNITLRWQVSIDGPSWINDEGRGEGSTDKIINNIKKYFSLISDKKIKNINIQFGLKPTVDIKYMRIMNDNLDLLIEWFKFFDDIIDDIYNTIKDCKTRISYPNTVKPTLVVPGKYTKEDGITLARFFRNIRKVEKLIKDEGSGYKHANGSLNDYVGRLANIVQNYNDISINQSNSTCSGGDTQLGLNFEGNIFPCHRLFLFDNDNYIKSVLKSDIDEWDVSKFNEGIINNIRKYMIVNKNSSENNLARYFYVMRGYHDSLLYKVSSTVSMIYELALSDQASSIYLRNEKLVILLALFLNSRMSCPVENYLQSGSFHVNPISVVRLFANGAFEELLKSYFEMWR